MAATLAHPRTRASEDPWPIAKSLSSRLLRNFKHPACLPPCDTAAAESWVEWRLQLVQAFLTRPTHTDGTGQGWLLSEWLPCAWFVSV